MSLRRPWQVSAHQPDEGSGLAHPGGLYPDEVAVKQEQVWTTRSLPVILPRALERASPTGLVTYARMCSNCKNGWVADANVCLLYKKGAKVPYVAPSCTLVSEGATWQLVIEEGKRSWNTHTHTHRHTWGINTEPPADGPQGKPLTAEDKVKLSVDASGLGQAPLPTSIESEVAFADAVPMSLRMSLREKVLEQTPADDDQAAAELLGFHEEAMKRKEKRVSRYYFILKQQPPSQRRPE